MNTILSFSLQTLATVLAADFTAGFVHWIEDAYIREHTPLLGRWIGRPNTLHHHLPRRMTRNTWWQSNWDLMLASGVVLAIAAMLGSLTWHIWLFAIVAGNANEVHKWAHRTRGENGRLISLLQDWRILQTPQHHAGHHTNPKQARYCTVTNLLNPLLDGMRFWSALEWMMKRIFGLRRQPDTSVPGEGGAPDWILEMRRAG